MILAGLVAGGSGTRMNSAVPKQFLQIGGEPILLRTIRTFCRVTEIDGILIGVPKDRLHETENMLLLLSESERFGKQIVICAGGESRADTLKNLMTEAEDVFGAGQSDLFLTHDAVRPFISEKVIRANIEAMKTSRACTTAVPANDTVLISMDGESVYTVPKRKTMFLAQTPQTVRFGEFREILFHMSAEELAETTDLCGIYAKKGIPVTIVPGEYENIKITTPTDMAVGEAILSKTMND